MIYSLHIEPTCLLHLLVKYSEGARETITCPL